jgi:hypothetical protein
MSVGGNIRRLNQSVEGMGEIDLSAKRYSTHLLLAK